MSLKVYRLPKIKVSRLGMLYILTMLIAELFQAGIVKGYYLTAVLISLFWTAMGLLSNSSSKARDIYKIKKMCIYLMIPWIIFILYNIYIYSIGVGYESFIKTSFVQIMLTPCILLGALGSYSIFKKNTIRYFLYSVMLSYIITLIYELFILGPSDFFAGILTIFSGNSIGNPFELNSDLVLALGLIVIYGLDNIGKENLREHIPTAFIILLVLLGGKRIEILAIIAVIIGNIIVKLLSEKNRYIIQTVISVFIVLFSLAFIYSVISGLFTKLCIEYEINTMGRVKMWEYIAQFSDFKLDYMGMGYSFSNLMLETSRIYTYMGRTYTLHSDVLKIYFDLGFIIFLFWATYTLVLLPRKVRKKFGYKVGNFCWFVCLYSYVLYFTDNTINYMIFQTVFAYVMFSAVILNDKNYKTSTSYKEDRGKRIWQGKLL